MYRVEIFDENMSFVSSCLMDKTQPIMLDYLAFDVFALDVTAANCKKGYFVHVAQNNLTIADGLISDVQPINSGVRIAVRPLQALFDVEVVGGKITDAAQWIAQQINSQFVENEDILQNRPINVAETGTAGEISIDSQIVNLMDVMVSAFEMYSVVVDASINMSTLKIDVSILPQTETITLEADLPNVIAKSIVLGDSYGGANKAIIREIGTSDGIATVLSTSIFYLHPNGTIDQSNSDRITPVFWAMRDVHTSEDFAAVAQSAAEKLLAPQKNDNEVTLTYSINDRVVEPLSIPIGAQATIYINQIAYDSILTGREIIGNKISLVFGMVRTALTKKLILERRNK